MGKYTGTLVVLFNTLMIYLMINQRHMLLVHLDNLRAGILAAYPWAIQDVNYITAMIIFTAFIDICIIATYARRI